MEVKTIRFFIYLFLTVIGIFSFLMVINFFGSHTGKRAAESTPKEEGGIAGSFYGFMKYDRSSPTTLPSSREGLSTASVRTEGAIMLVRDENFDGVAQSPKGRIATLMEMGGGKKKGPSPVSLGAGAKLGKISMPVSTEPHKAGAAMPLLGSKAGPDGLTPVAAPADYKVFKSSAVWQAFADSRRIKNIQHDFSASDLLILFSVSDFPSGIFKIAGVERSVKETVVKYRVDPLAMAAGADPAGREVYASAPVPRKGPPIRLELLP